jgi:hypothetical protein
MIKPETKFGRTLERRLALSSLILENAQQDHFFGRVKLAKLFYLADAHLKLKMDAEYVREAAGPLDQYLLYNEKWGLEAQARKQAIFEKLEGPSSEFESVRYKKGKNLEAFVRRAESLFVDKIENIRGLLSLLNTLSAKNAEIVATLYACWNDLLSRSVTATEQAIIQDFRTQWHESKRRFAEADVLAMLTWMREHNLVPDGTGPICRVKPDKVNMEF